MYILYLCNTVRIINWNDFVILYTLYTLSCHLVILSVSLRSNMLIGMIFFHQKSEIFCSCKRDSSPYILTYDLGTIAGARADEDSELAIQRRPISFGLTHHCLTSLRRRNA